jgi:hypothetical protein
LETIREELSILALSELGYHPREKMVPIVAPGEISNAHMTYMIVNSRDGSCAANLFKRTKPFGQLVVDGRWKNYQDRVMFMALLKTLRGKTKVTEDWRDELHRVSVMIGESVGAGDLLKSFVWNWVALETLLTRKGDRVGEMLPRRAESLLGWVLLSDDPEITLWKAAKYEARIREVYGKRNRLLHEGKRDDITYEDVEFTDHLLLNLLSNLVAFPRLFDSKDAIIHFSEKVEAERILGVRPRVRPRDLRFIMDWRPGF